MLFPSLSVTNHRTLRTGSELLRKRNRKTLDVSQLSRTPYRLSNSSLAPQWTSSSITHDSSTHHRRRIPTRHASTKRGGAAVPKLPNLSIPKIRVATQTLPAADLRRSLVRALLISQHRAIHIIREESTPTDAEAHGSRSWGPAKEAI